MLEFIDTNILNIAIGLMGLMLVNILLGTGMSIIDETQQFDKKIFRKGVLKVILILVSFVIVYFCGVLNPEFITINVNGQTVNLVDGINIMLTLGAGVYGKKVYDKLSEAINLKITNEGM